MDNVRDGDLRGSMTSNDNLYAPNNNNNNEHYTRMHVKNNHKQANNLQSWYLTNTTVILLPALTVFPPFRIPLPLFNLPHPQSFSFSGRSSQTDLASEKKLKILDISTTSSGIQERTLLTTFTWAWCFELIFVTL